MSLSDDRVGADPRAEVEDGAPILTVSCPWCSAAVPDARACSSCGAVLTDAAGRPAAPGMTGPDLTEAWRSQTRRARAAGGVLTRLADALSFVLRGLTSP